MTDEELTQFGVLLKKYERGKDKDRVLKLVQDDAHEVFQEINDGGRRAANLAWETKGLEKKLTDAETAKVAAEGKLAELDGKAPDAAKLRADFKKEVETLEVKHKSDLEAKDRVIFSERLDKAQSQLVTDLVELGINAEYARTIVVKRDDVVARMKPDEKGVIQVMKAGSENVPLVANGQKSAVRLLAEELEPAVDNQWRVSKVKRGSATRTDTSTGGTAKVPNKFDAIREREKEHGKQNAGRGQDEGLGRLRGSRAGTK